MGTGIQWCDETWNPVTGCTKVSPGCKNCYAERVANRLKGMGQKKYRNGFELTLHDDALTIPLKWKKPRMIFVNSMSDLFHEGVPDEYIQEVFAVMGKCPQHVFQVLTKRASRMALLSKDLPWGPNVWAGVSVESEDYLDRIDLLRQVPTTVRFLSIEPLLGPLLCLDLHDIDWVIVGGESGPNHRDIDPNWVADIRDQCVKAGVPFFFKQWGGLTPKAGGRELDGRTWDEMPKP